MKRRPPTENFPPDLRVVKTREEKREELAAVRMRGSHKMSKLQADYVLDLAAQFCGPVEIARRLENHEDPEFRLKISSNAIGRYMRRHTDQIEARRKRYMNDLGATPLAYKRYRLHTLQEIIDSCKDEKTGAILNHERLLDALKVAAWEMNRFGFYDRELGSGESDVKEAEDFLAGIGVGRIAGDKVLRRKK